MWKNVWKEYLSCAPSFHVITVGMAEKQIKYKASVDKPPHWTTLLTRQSVRE